MIHVHIAARLMRVSARIIRRNIQNGLLFLERRRSGLERFATGRGGMIKIQVPIKMRALVFKVELRIGISLITALLYFGSHEVRA